MLRLSFGKVSIRYRKRSEKGAGREREWNGNGLDGRADPNVIRADIKTDAKERGKVRDPEEKIKKNANFKEKIWRNQYFFVTLHDNKKKLIPGLSLKGEMLTPGLSLKGRMPTPRPLPEGKGEKEKERKRERDRGRKRDWELKSEK